MFFHKNARDNKMQSKLRQSAALHESAQQEQFDEVAYEKEWLEKEAEAMDAFANHSVMRLLCANQEMLSWELRIQQLMTHQ